MIYYALKEKMAKPRVCAYKNDHNFWNTKIVHEFLSIKDQSFRLYSLE